MEKEFEGQIPEQKESVELTKNAKGDYQWKIKILDLDVKKIDQINKQMEEKYGKKEDSTN